MVNTAATVRGPMGDPIESPLSREDILHVATLASLDLSEPEVDRLVGELAAIIDYMKSLDAVDVTGVEPTYQPVLDELPRTELRVDEVRPSLSPDRVLADAPSSEQGGFAVPRVLDGDG